MQLTLGVGVLHPAVFVFKVFPLGVRGEEHLGQQQGQLRKTLPVRGKGTPPPPNASSRSSFSSSSILTIPSGADDLGFK
jgi:hypothetical protein